MEKSHVSMEQKLCIICGKQHDSGNILLDMKLRKSMERHTLIGYGHCDDCQAKVDEGYVAAVEISNDGEGEGKRIKTEDAIRTGTLVWIRKSLLDQMLDVAITTPMIFITPDFTEILKNLKKQEV